MNRAHLLPLIAAPVRDGNVWRFPDGKTLPVVAGADHDTKVSFPELDEIEGRIKSLARKADDIIDQATESDGTVSLARVKGYGKDFNEVNAEFTRLQAEMADLGVEADKLRPLKAAAIARAERQKRGIDSPSEPGDGGRKGGDGDARYKSLGEVMKAAGLLTANTKGDVDWDVVAKIDGLKTLFETATGWTPEVTMGPRFVDLPSTPYERLLSLLPTSRTNQAAVKYLIETLVTNAAATVAEGAQKPEAALAVDEDDAVMRKIAVTLPVTDEQFDDEPRAERYVNNRLERMILQYLAGQIVNGDGVGTNILGFLSTPGILTQAKGGDPTPDAVYKAMVKVMVTGEAFPNAYLTNPLDWVDVRLLRTNEGIYIWGNPSEAGPERIWSLPVVQLQQLPEGTGLVLDTLFTELVIRKDVAIDTGYVNNQFRENKKTVRAEMRGNVIVYRPQALCSVTGI